MEIWKLRQEQPALTTADSSTAFLVKSLLFPVIPVVVLVICLLTNGVPLRGPYFLIAVLSFLGSADFLGTAQLRGNQSRRLAMHSLFFIVSRWSALLAMLAVLLHLAALTDLYDLRVLLVWALVTPLLLWLGQQLAHAYLLRQGGRARPARKAVIVGVTEHGVRLEESLRQDPLLHTQIVAYFEDRSRTRSEVQTRAPVAGTTAGLADYIRQNSVNVVYITLPISRSPRVTAILDELRDTTASIYFVPDLYVFDLIQARFDIVNGVPVVAVCESPFFGVLPLVKRLTDVVIASLVLALASPVFLLCALAIRHESPGPVLFKQRRYGLDGREILVCKFRSMTVTEDGEASYTQVTKGDSRVTRVGAFLRRTSLDELPQFINVLQGSMSVVGPRPHAIAVNERYRQLIPSYMNRHMVKPGITGWAQVNGHRGGDDLESMAQRVQFDLDYLRYWSPWLDFAILFKTALMVWHDRRAY